MPRKTKYIGTMQTDKVIEALFLLALFWCRMLTNVMYYGKQQMTHVRKLRTKICSTVHSGRENKSHRTDAWKPYRVGRKEKGVKMLAVCLFV